MRSSAVTIDAELKAGSKGVLYALGGFSGGISVWIDGGKLNDEYNLYEIERTRLTSAKPLPAGKATIEIESTRASGERLSAMDIALRVSGQVVATGRVPRTTGYSMTSNDSFDVGRDSYSPVSPAYYDRAPFAFSSASVGSFTLAMSSACMCRSDSAAYAWARFQAAVETRGAYAARYSVPARRTSASAGSFRCGRSTRARPWSPAPSALRPCRLAMAKPMARVAP